MSLVAEPEDATPFPSQSQAGWSSGMAASFAALGIPGQSAPRLHRRRHGGASHDVVVRKRTLDEVQKRGAWRTATSMARYA